MMIYISDPKAEVPALIFFSSSFRASTSFSRKYGESCILSVPQGFVSVYCYCQFCTPSTPQIKLLNGGRGQGKQASPYRTSGATHIPFLVQILYPKHGSYPPPSSLGSTLPVPSTATLPNISSTSPILPHSGGLRSSVTWTQPPVGFALRSRDQRDCADEAANAAAVERTEGSCWASWDRVIWRKGRNFGLGVNVEREGGRVEVLPRERLGVGGAVGRRVRRCEEGTVGWGWMYCCIL